MVTLLSAHAVPAVLNYAGQVAVNGQPFDGQGLFKFALVNADGNATYWSNDGTSTNGSEPAAHVSIPVNGSLYSLLLGNTAMSGMVAIDPQVFAQHGDAKLRVWFSDGVNGFQQLSPDRPFASVPYAFNSKSADTANTANTAMTVQAGAITKQMLGQDVLSDLNRTVTAQMIQSSSITTAKLNEQILKYLKPEITTHPQAPGLIFSGQSMNLASQAEGKFLTYQWNRNGQPIAGATGPSFSIADVNGTLHDGNYSVVVSNDFGSVTSSPTSLQVDGTPSAHTVASIGIEMIFCPPGTFTMGSPTSETGRGGDETQHQVTLTNGFYLGKYEVTQAQYEIVMTGNSEGLNAKPSNWPNNNDRPVDQVSWNNVQVFLSRLNDLEQTAGRLSAGWRYVLPTEAQWEYACRAGMITKYSWGNDINSSLANYSWDGGWNNGSDLQRTRDVGQYVANPWGFFDMHGNLHEWVHDWYGDYVSGLRTNPEGPATGTSRVLRGGSWAQGLSDLRSSKRGTNPPWNLTRTHGFRLAFQAMPADTANPELELFGGAGITREAGQVWSEPGVAGHDARDGNLTSSITVSGTVDMNTTGTYLLTYSVADAAGNTDSATRTVTVVGNRTVDLNATVALDMIWCPPGNFTMGSPTTESGRGTDENETDVTLTRGFYLGKYEVTQAQYTAVINGNSIGMNPNPSQVVGSLHPVEFVSRIDIEAFINVLNSQHPEIVNQGWEFVLPTEAEWEYACRAGTTTPYSWGNGINPSNANYVGSGFGTIREVGTYASNPWGFYDMHGNIIEWVDDWYDSYAVGPLVNPNGPETGSRGILRGGSYSSWYPVRSAQRVPVNSVGYQHTGAGGFGFRISLKKSVPSG
ncbi:MAG: SUMF1/EgtB/PvdO family nonheme iron enzyme [Opitutales bacterium]